VLWNNETPPNHQVSDFYCYVRNGMFWKDSLDNFIFISKQYYMKQYSNLSYIELGNVDFVGEYLVLNKDEVVIDHLEKFNICSVGNELIVSNLNYVKNGSLIQTFWHHTYPQYIDQEDKIMYEGLRVYDDAELGLHIMEIAKCYRKDSELFVKAFKEGQRNVRCLS